VECSLDLAGKTETHHNKAGYLLTIYITRDLLTTIGNPGKFPQEVLIAPKYMKLAKIKSISHPKRVGLMTLDTNHTPFVRLEKEPKPKAVRERA